MDDIENFKSYIDDIHVEYDRRNSAIPLYNFLHAEARIEPGALIRDMVTILLLTTAMVFRLCMGILLLLMYQ